MKAIVHVTMCLLGFLVTLCLLPPSLTAPAPVSAPGGKTAENAALGQFPGVPAVADLDIPKPDDEAASDDLDALSDLDGAEDSERDDLEAEDSLLEEKDDKNADLESDLEEDNSLSSEEDDENAHSDLEAENSLLEGKDDDNIRHSHREEGWQIKDLGVTWRTPQAPSADDEGDLYPFEKRRPSDTVSSEAREGLSKFRRGRQRGTETGKDQAISAYPPRIRVIELNETLYLNNTNNDKPTFEPVAMPDSFEDYDVNRNGWISLPELRYVTGATEGASDAFRAADTNRDGRVDRNEFLAAMWGAQVDQPPPSGLVMMPAEELRPSSIPRARGSDGRQAP